MAAYCKSKGVAEEEGGSNDLHLLLAPFLLLLNQSSLLDKTLLQFLSSLVGKYLPLQHNKEKATTACAKQLFRLLLMYHDPALCSHFDQVNCSVHDFTPLWFRRFFATLGPLECVLQLWDFLFVHADPFLHYFLALCIVTANRETLLKHEEKQAILKYLEEITIQSTTQVQQLTRTALELVANTPMSFREQLFAVIFDTNDYNAWLKRFLFPHSAFSTPTCLHVSVQEVAHSSSVTIQRGGVKFFVFDCRPLEQYQHGRLPTAFHLPPRMLLEKPEEFNQLMAEFLPLKGNHFTFLGSGSMEMETYLELIVLQFLQHGFAHVSVVRGGYEALHTFIEKRQPEQVDWNSELTDHDPKKCLVCVQKRSPSSSPSHSSPTMTRTAKVVTPQKDGSQQTAATTNPLSGVSKSLFSSKLSSSISSMIAGRRATTSTQQEGSKPPEQTVTTKKQAATPNRNERKEEEGEEEEDRPLFTIDEDDEEDVDKTSNLAGKPRNQTESGPNTGSPSTPINLVSSFWGRSTDNKSKTESATNTTASNNQKLSGWLVWGRARSSSNPQEEGKGAEAGENAATRTPFIGEEGKKKLVAAASEAKQQLKKAVSSFLLLEDDEQTNENTANLSLPPRRMEYVPLDSLVEAHPSWIFFACHKVTKEKKLLPWFLVVTFEHLVELRVHPTQRFMVALYRSIALPRILKITFRKKEPKLLAFLVSKTSSSSMTKSRSGSVGEEKRSDDDAEKKEESADAAEADKDGEQEKEDKGKDKVVLEGEAQHQQLASNVQTEAAATVTLLYVVQHPTECIQAIADASEHLLASHSATS
ncbi:TBC1 domain family member 23, variant 2 [Balamuthia mandrillaris]